MRRVLLAMLLAGVAAGCATLGQVAALVRPPTFAEAPDHPAEVRLLPSTGANGFGAASVRLWINVSNPNPFGFTVATLGGTLFLEDARAATADFPLGLPLPARGEAIVPIELSVEFSDIPQLSGVVRKLIGRQSIAYRLDGTVGVDAGTLGTPTFGPMTIVRGSARPLGSLLGDAIGAQRQGTVRLETGRGWWRWSRRT